MGVSHSCLSDDSRWGLRKSQVAAPEALGVTLGLSLCLASPCFSMAALQLSSRRACPAPHPCTLYHTLSNRKTE